MLTKPKMPKLAIEANGNCGPSSLSAELIIAFYKGELKNHFKFKNFKTFVNGLCVTNKVQYTDNNARVSLEAFFAAHPNDAQVLLAQYIRERMADLANREDQKDNVLIELTREWKLVKNKKEKLTQGKHIFHGMQNTLEKIQNEKALEKWYQKDGGFNYYINTIKIDKEYTNVQPGMVRFAEHLRLNLTVNDSKGDNKYVNGMTVESVQSPTLKLHHSGCHFTSHRLNNLQSQNQRQKVKVQRADFFRSSDIIQLLLTKGIQDYVEDDRVKILSEKDRKQIKDDYQFAREEQQKEIDRYYASLKP